MIASAPRLAPRAATIATQRRRSRARAGRYASHVRFIAVLAAVLGLVMVYVMLTARLTSLNYAEAKAEVQREQLQSETSRLEDRLAVLESDERLAAIAAKLHMVPAQQFALVRLPAPAQAADHTHLAFIYNLTRFFRR